VILSFHACALVPVDRQTPAADVIAILEIKRPLFNRMHRPTVDQLPPALRRTATSIASTLRDAGFEAWLVGGCVRDLALGKTPVEIDMATDALPDRVESLFDHTTPVGKAFGTMVVHVALGDESIDVELTTFRSDGAYLDGRRPEMVTYGSSVEEDAGRRDFTCNALYLDPLGGDFQDPEQGLRDLEARVLRAIGNPPDRFREDGLRILRLARFAATLELEVEAATLQGAAETSEMLRSVSPERILRELIRIFAADAPVKALALLHDCGALGAALPDLVELCPPGWSGEDFLRRRLAAVEALGHPPDAPTGLAVLLDPDPLGDAGGERAERLAGRARAQLEWLHPSRLLRGTVTGVWHLQRILWRSLSAERSRAERIRMFRHPAWPSASLSLGAWLAAAGSAGQEEIDDFEAERSRLTEEELFPAPLLTSEDLDASGIERGPRWGQLLEEAETLQLDLVLTDREQALRWLRERA